MFGLTKIGSQCLLLILSCSLIAAAVIDIGESVAVSHEPAVASMSSVNLDTEDASTSATPIDRTTQRSEVKKFLRRVQSTLERAEPFLDEVEKEAKRLEQTAKQFGEGLIRSFKGMMGRIMGSDGKGGIPSIFSIIRIGGKQGNLGIHIKQEEPCVTDNKMTETKTPTTTEATATIMDLAVKNATKMELPATKTITTTTSTTAVPDIFVDIAEDANAFDNEI